MNRGLPALGLLLLIALLYPGAALAKGVFFQRDIHWVWYPRIESVVRGVAGGAWPLWDPSATFGLPALADPSYQIAYPLTWLNLIVGPATYMKLYILAHTFGAGLGLYCLSRRCGLSRLSAFFAGAAWSASGPLLSTADLWHHLAGGAWIPWVLLALERALSLHTTASALVLGAAAAGQLLAGSGDMCLMSGLLGLARIVWFLLSRESGVRAQAAVRIARTGLVAGVFAVLLAAVQWLPTGALLEEGSRLGMSSAASMFWSVHPATLADLVVPGLVTDLPMNDAARAVLFESREPFLAGLYLGLGVCLLALLGLLAGQRRLASATGLACLAFLILALGRHTPVYPLLLEIPPFAMVRYPVKYMVAVSLLAALLSGLGVETWLRLWSRAEKRAAAVVAAVASVLGLVALTAGMWIRLRPSTLQTLLDPGLGSPGDVVPKLQGTAALALGFSVLVWLRRRRPSTPGWLTVVLVLLCLGDVTAAGQHVNAVAPPELLSYRPQWVASLRREPWPERLHLAPYPYALQYRRLRPRSGWPSDWLWTLGLQDLLSPPIGGRWGLSGSYDGDFTGLAPRPLSTMTLMVVRSWRTPLALRLLQMGSVENVVTLEEQPWLGSEPRLVESVFSAPIRVYRVPDPLPRTYAVAGVRVAPEPEAYALVQQDSFDPRHEVILDQGSPRAPVPSFSGVTRLLWRRADALAVEADLSEPGYVVVVEAYQSGWRATVDSEPAEVFRANLLFRAVRVPAGHHVVEMAYRPPAAVLGALLSAAGVSLGVLWWAWRERLHSAPGAPV